ncbi:MAG: oxidoreductase [Bacteroidetes bacterium GWE2_41_25]|nr:MAG: oxidoreductase [Bacteroidetes bacterium GWE2_41_25]HCU18630.1 gfo/Idh/MocA family oxidoreductase [Bacteroidales bacterium]
MNKRITTQSSSRRDFIKITSLGTAALGLQQFGCSGGGKTTEPVIPGFEAASAKRDPSEGWAPFSDRKLRVGLVGYGACRFGASFGFQDHPNVEVVAVSDLFPERCAQLAKVTRCNKTFPSLEEMVKDDKIEAIFCATDAPSHARHAMEVLRHGKHVAVAVPAVFGSLEEADELLEAVKKSGLKYMMFETSCFHEDIYAMRKIYKAGGFGKLVYTEGEYYHGPSLTKNEPPLGSYKNWRDGMPPQWYPTHSNAYYIGVTDGTFTEVSCIGTLRDSDQPANNQYKNPFTSEIALFRTDEGGIARMARTRTPGLVDVIGRVQGEKGFFYGKGESDKGEIGTYNMKYVGYEKNLPDLNRPPIPPGVPPGGHDGSHGPLMNEFVLSIFEDRKPLVDIEMSLNLTVSGIIAHESALKGGEMMKIPQYKV